MKPLKVKGINMEQRLLSGFGIGACFIISILWAPMFFNVLMVLVATGMLIEWYNMTESSLPSLVSGLFIIPIPIICLMLVSIIDSNRWLLLLYFVTIWSVDTFAMFGGKSLGGPKLAPRISPNKTWSGLIVGMLAAALMCGLITLLPEFTISNTYKINYSYLTLVSMSIAAVAQISDLFISYFKRRFGIKDSGNIIPGHGGVLDRFDSIILTAPILLLITYFI